ncbi:hypothetical protein RHOER0001_0230 [Rhodococcus erythropolis SK121]|nr:hypothetical protein RHOER0001_0230 [Rhodococcus erythropolis SK121]
MVSDVHGGTLHQVGVLENGFNPVVFRSLCSAGPSFIPVARHSLEALGSSCVLPSNANAIRAIDQAFCFGH